MSKSTASLVLNGRSKEYRVSDDTRDRILALAHEHHYQPSIHARSLRSNRSHTLGLVVPEMTNYGFAVISRELETLCREAGLQLLIACTDENPAQEMMAVNSLVQRQVDGFDRRLQPAERRGIPEDQRRAPGGADGPPDRRFRAAAGDHRFG